MATLNINGRRVTVDDSFLALPPEEQDATVEEIAASLGSASPQPSPEFDTRPQMGPAIPADYKAPEAPWYEAPVQAIGDISRLASNPFGLGDRARAALPGGLSLEQERLKTAAAEERAGLAGTVANVAGTIAALPAGGAVAGAARGLDALASLSVPGARFLSAPARVLAAPSTMTGATGVGARTLTMGAEGAGLGAASAAVQDQDVGTGALIGGLAGAGGNVLGETVARGVGSVAGRFNKQPVVPTTDEIKAASRAAYKAADDAGVIIKPTGMTKLRGEIVEDLTELGYHPSNAPKVTGALSHLNELTQGNVTLKGVETLRRMAGAARMDADPFQREIGRQFTKKVDKFLDNLDASDVLAGNRTQGVKALQEARKGWSVAKKSELIEDAMQRAEVNASSAGKGGNVENVRRQQIKNILNNPKKRAAFSTGEQEAMRQYVKGTLTQNALRHLGGLAPTTGALSLLLNVGAAGASGGLSLAASAAGQGAKMVADRASQNNLNAIARLIRSGGDPKKLEVAKNAVQKLSEQERQTLGRILMSLGVTTGVPAAQ